MLLMMGSFYYIYTGIIEVCFASYDMGYIYIFICMTFS